MPLMLSTLPLSTALTGFRPFDGTTEIRTSPAPLGKCPLLTSSTDASIPTILNAGIATFLK